MKRWPTDHGCDQFFSLLLFSFSLWGGGGGGGSIVVTVIDIDSNHGHYQRPEMLRP